MASTRALLESFKFLRLQEIVNTVDLVSHDWHRIAEKAELWSFLLEQELLVHRLSPLCQQDYPSLAAKYISCRGDFIDFWRGASAPTHLVSGLTRVQLWSCRERKALHTGLEFAEGYRAVVTGRDTLVVTGYSVPGQYKVLEYDINTRAVRELPKCRVNRTFHAAAADAENVYLSGGTQQSNSAEVLRSGRWEDLPNMNYPANRHTMVIINSRLFTFGGHHDKAELLDGPEWRSLDLFLPLAFADFGVAVASFKEVLLVGGSSMMKTPCYVYSLNLMTGFVTRLAKTDDFLCTQNATYLSNKETVTAISADGDVKTFHCPLAFTVRAKSVLRGSLHRASLRVLTTDTIASLAQKFRDAVRPAQDARLLVYVDGRLASDEWPVVTADLKAGSEVDFVQGREE